MSSRLKALRAEYLGWDYYNVCLLLLVLTVVAVTAAVWVKAALFGVPA